MVRNSPDRVEEQRTAVLLGLPTAELRSYSLASDLGHLESGDLVEQMVFTYHTGASGIFG
jgi:hypothetical protein